MRWMRDRGGDGAFGVAVGVAVVVVGWVAVAGVVVVVVVVEGVVAGLVAVVVLDGVVGTCPGRCAMTAAVLTQSGHAYRSRGSTQFLLLADGAVRWGSRLQHETTQRALDGARSGQLVQVRRMLHRARRRQLVFWWSWFKNPRSEL